MDQEIVAGIGNEYSDEILFQAGIDPRHRVRDLDQKAQHALYTHMQAVLRYAIEVRQTNMNDETSFDTTYLQAHRHGDKLCPKNSTHKLKHETIAGRTAYYCPEHQK